MEQLSNGAAVDWLVTLHSHSSELAAYEKVLLAVLFGDTDRMWLSELTGSRAAGMRRVAAALRRDAVRAGWLRRWRKGEQTKRGELLRRQIRAFEQELLDNGLPAEANSFRQLLPYAMVVGRVSRQEQVPPIYHPLVSFALAWTSCCESIPGWRPRLGPVEPSSSFDEHYYPLPSSGGGDGFAF